jgi:hypothetical protein
MGADSTVHVPVAWNAGIYWGAWALCLGCLGIIVRDARRPGRRDPWSTQDLLIVAAMAALLEVYDNIIGDDFVKPLVDVVPGMRLLQVHDLPYMFLVMVGVALVRKPGCVTAMVFLNFLLAQLLFGSDHGVLDWTDGLTQGVFCDLYLLMRRGRGYRPGAAAAVLVLDGFVLGVLRGGPNKFLGDFSFDPYLSSAYSTWYRIWVDTASNAVGNGLEAALVALTAWRVAQAVMPSLRADSAAADAAGGRFGEGPGSKAAGGAA